MKNTQNFLSYVSFILSAKASGNKGYFLVDFKPFELVFEALHFGCFFCSEILFGFLPPSSKDPEKNELRALVCSRELGVSVEKESRFGTGKGA